MQNSMQFCHFKIFVFDKNDNSDNNNDDDDDSDESIQYDVLYLHLTTRYPMDNWKWVNVTYW